MMQEFEKHIRLIMQNAEEEVPPQVWDAVSKHLDRQSSRPRVVAFPWRRFAAAVSAAAAIAAGVFLSLPKHSAPAPYSTAGLTREPVEVIVPGLTPAREIALLADRSEWIPANPETLSQETVPTPSEEGASPAASQARPSSVPASGEDPDEINRKFNELAFEEGRKTSGTLTYTVSGNVLSNGSPHNGRASLTRMMTSSRGPSETTVSDTDPSGVYGAPLSFGLGIMYPLSPRLAIGTGLVYSRLPRTYHGTFTQVENGKEVKSVTGTIDNVQHYIGIPINLYYKFFEDRNFRFYSYAGGAVEKGIVDHYRISGTSEVVNWSKVAPGLQLSAGLGLGVEFRLGEHLGLYVDPSMRYYFEGNQPRSIRTQQPLMMSLEVGMRFGL